LTQALEICHDYTSVTDVTTR